MTDRWDLGTNKMSAEWLRWRKWAKGKILIAVLALTVFFLSIVVVLKVFQISEEKVKYDLLFVRKEGSRENQNGH